MASSVGPRLSPFWNSRWVSQWCCFVLQARSGRQKCDVEIVEERFTSRVGVSRNVVRRLGAPWCLLGAWYPFYPGNTVTVTWKPAWVSWP